MCIFKLMTKETYTSFLNLQSISIPASGTMLKWKYVNVHNRCIELLVMIVLLLSIENSCLSTIFTNPFIIEPMNE